MRALLYIPVFLLMVLGGCGGGTLADLAEPTKLLLRADTPEKQEAAAKAIVDDLKEALRSAEVHEDAIGAACWRGILVRFEKVEGSYFTDVKGAATGLQKARNIRRLATDLSEDIKIACAALVSDTRSSVFSVFKLVGLPVP